MVEDEHIKMIVFLIIFNEAALCELKAEHLLCFKICYVFLMAIGSKPGLDSALWTSFILR